MRPLTARGLLALALLLYPSVRAIAQAPVPVPPGGASVQAGLTELLRQAAENNPELEAARRRVQAAAEVPRRAYSLPDPVLGTVIRNVDFPELTLGDEMMSTVGVRFSQGLPTGGKRPARRAHAEEGIQVALARVRLVQWRINREITQTWYQLAFVHRSLEIVERTRDLLRDLEATAEARYRVGGGLQQDVLKAQVELSVLLNRIVALEQQRDTLETRLNELAGRHADAAVATPGAIVAVPAAPDRQVIHAEARADSAWILAQSRRIDQQQAAVEVARTGRSPDLMLSGAWMSRGGLPSIWEVNVGITLPIRKAERQDREIAEASEELRARREETRSAVLDVEATVREHLLELDRANRLIELFQEAILPQATLSLDSTMSGYSVGSVDFLTVLDSVVKLLTYELELEREKSTAMRALAGLEEHVGRSLGASPDDAWTVPEPPLVDDSDTERTAFPAGNVNRAGGER